MQARQHNRLVVESWPKQKLIFYTRYLTLKSLFLKPFPWGVRLPKMKLPCMMKKILCT